MKRTLLILFLIITQFTVFSQGVVKLTDGEPAYIPSYLIIEGNLYFKTNIGYTSLGDLLFYYVSKGDSSKLFYTPRQLDSLLNTKSFSQWIDVEGGIEYPSGNLSANDTAKLNNIISQQIRTHNILSNKFYVTTNGDTTTAGTWKYEIIGDTLQWSVRNGAIWNVIDKSINN